MSQSEDTSTTIERLLVIKAIPLFAEVLPEDLAVIAEHARLQAFAKGDVLFSASEHPASTIHLVLDGCVIEHRGGRPFQTHGPHSVLGGVDALALSSGDVTAVADEDTHTLSINRAALAEILEDNFGILWITLQGVAAATLNTRRRLPNAGFDDHADAGDTTAELPGELAARIAFLQRHTGLGRMKIRTLAQLAHEAEVVTADRRQELWTEGESAEHAVIVIHGVVAGATPAGQRFEAGRGTVLGMEEALAMEPRWYGARTRGPTAWFSVSRAAIIDALEDDSDSAVEALAAMAMIASVLRDRLAREIGDDDT